MQELVCVCIATVIDHDGYQLMSIIREEHTVAAVDKKIQFENKNFIRLVR